MNCRKVVLIGLANLALVACAAPWTDKDTKSGNDAIRAQRALDALCSSDGGCTPGQVHAVERAVECNIGSMVFRHAGDAGIMDPGACQP